MRAAGTLLTILALVAVQAPWIVCACDGDTSLTSLLAGVIAHDESGHESAADHAHHCCDGVAHAIHGVDHAHGRHCHGTFGHDHRDENEGDDPEAPTERHDGFRLALRTLPTAVSLDDHAPAPAAFLAVLADATWHVLEARAEVVDPDPSERATLPAACTERLLL